MTDFTAHVRRQDDLVVAELHGRLDGTATTAMEALHGQVVANDVGGVLVDFTDVDYINSTGIALVVGLAAKAWTSQLPVLACGLSPHYEHIFTITRITEFVRLHPDQDAAVAAHRAASGGVAPAPAG